MLATNFEFLWFLLRKIPWSTGSSKNLTWSFSDLNTGQDQPHQQTPGPQQKEMIIP